VSDVFNNFLNYQHHHRKQNFSFSGGSGSGGGGSGFLENASGMVISIACSRVYSG